MSSLGKCFNKAVMQAQHKDYCHKKLMKILEKSFKISNIKELSKVFFHNLIGFYCYDFADKNPYVARGLEFLAKLAVNITLKCVVPTDITDSNGSISKVYDITTDPFFTDMLEYSLKYASVEKTEVRFNTCFFISALLQNIGNNVEMDHILCNTILEALLDLLHDPKVNVRLQALKALVRLQEPTNPDCVVLKSFLLLSTDAKSEIRKAVLKLIALHPQSFSKILERLSDIDIGVRQAAYSKLADINPKLYLKIVDRNFVLTRAFADDNKRINFILTEKLLPKWLNSYGGNYMNFLKALKLDADENDIKNFESLCTKVLDVFMKNDPLSDILKYLPICKEDKLIPVQQLHLESVLYWSRVVTFLRKTEGAENYLEDTIPELRTFSYYIERVIKEKSASMLDDWEKLEYQNIVYQLFEIALGYDMSDEVGRKTLYSLIIQILSTYKFQQKVIDRIITVARELSTSSDFFITDICQVISDIREPLMDEIVSTDKLRERNFEITQLKVKIHQLEISEEEAVKKKDFEHAGIFNNEIWECKRQLESLSNMCTVNKVRVSKDDPETLCRCLDVLIGLLKMGKIKGLTDSLRSCKDEFLMPLLTNSSAEVHWRFILCLGLLSLRDHETAAQNAHFICLPIATYKTLPKFDKTALKISISCVTDIIRLYGVEIVGIQKNADQERNQTNTRRKLYSEDMEELSVADEENINADCIFYIILDMLDDEDEEVRDTAVTSLSRLMVHNFSVNPELIHRFILKWFNPLSEQRDLKLQQKIGITIKYFAENVKGARKIIAQAITPIITSLVNAPRTSPLIAVDIDNVLKFLSALTNISVIGEENIHNDIALQVLDKMLKSPQDISTPHFAKLLSYLEVFFEEQSLRNDVVDKAQQIIEELMDKVSKKYLWKFIKKVTINSEDTQLTNNSEAPSMNTITTNNGGHMQSSLQEMENPPASRVRKRLLDVTDFQKETDDEDRQTGNTSDSESDLEYGDHSDMISKYHKKVIVVVEKMPTVLTVENKKKSEPVEKLNENLSKNDKTTNKDVTSVQSREELKNEFIKCDYTPLKSKTNGDAIFSGKKSADYMSKEDILPNETPRSRNINIISSVTLNNMRNNSANLDQIIAEISASDVESTLRTRTQLLESSSNIPSEVSRVNSLKSELKQSYTDSSQATHNKLKQSSLQNITPSPKSRNASHLKTAQSQSSAPATRSSQPFKTQSGSSQVETRKNTRSSRDSSKVNLSVEKQFKNISRSMSSLVQSSGRSKAQPSSPLKNHDNSKKKSREDDSPSEGPNKLHSEISKKESLPQKNRKNYSRSASPSVRSSRRKVQRDSLQMDHTNSKELFTKVQVLSKDTALKKRVENNPDGASPDGLSLRRSRREIRESVKKKAQKVEALTEDSEKLSPHKKVMTTSQTSSPNRHSSRKSNTNQDCPRVSQSRSEDSENVTKISSVEKRRKNGFPSVTLVTRSHSLEVRKKPLKDGVSSKYTKKHSRSVTPPIRSSRRSKVLSPHNGDLTSNRKSLKKIMPPKDSENISSKKASSKKISEKVTPTIQSPKIPLQTIRSTSSEIRGINLRKKSQKDDTPFGYPKTPQRKSSGNCLPTVHTSQGIASNSPQLNHVNSKIKSQTSDVLLKTSQRTSDTSPSETGKVVLQKLIGDEPISTLKEKLRKRKPQTPNSTLREKPNKKPKINKENREVLGKTIVVDEKLTRVKRTSERRSDEHKISETPKTDKSKQETLLVRVLRSQSHSNAKTQITGGKRTKSRSKGNIESAQRNENKKRENSIPAKSKTADPKLLHSSKCSKCNSSPKVCVHNNLEVTSENLSDRTSRRSNRSKRNSGDNNTSRTRNSSKLSKDSEQQTKANSTLVISITRLQDTSMRKTGNSSRKRLHFSPVSNGVDLKNISIDDATSSNNSRDSNKENVSFNMSFSSSSPCRTRSSARRRPRDKDSSANSSDSSPSHKIRRKR